MKKTGWLFIIGMILGWFMEDLRYVLTGILEKNSFDDVRRIHILTPLDVLYVGIMAATFAVILKVVANGVGKWYANVWVAVPLATLHVTLFTGLADLLVNGDVLHGVSPRYSIANLTDLFIYGFDKWTLVSTVICVSIVVAIGRLLGSVGAGSSEGPTQVAIPLHKRIGDALKSFRERHKAANRDLGLKKEVSI